MKDRKLKAVFFGRWGEALACFILRLKGYKILHRNLRNKGGEIDIIARKSKTLCFIEVKSRPTITAACECFSITQQKRIVRAAGAFLSSNHRYAEYSCRFDFIAVSSKGRLHHIKNAWFDEE